MGCEQGRTGKERNEFKPVAFNQASARVLGDKLDALKRQQFGLFGSWGENGGEGRRAPLPQLCCSNVAPRYEGFPTTFPSLPKCLGFVQGSKALCFEFHPCKSCFIAYQALAEALKEILHVHHVNVARDCSKKLEEAFCAGLLV